MSYLNDKKILEKIKVVNIGIDIDNALSETSENPVQNKVITEELLKKANLDASNLTEENVASWQDKLGGKVLWENANPTANFNAQKITLASDDYDFLLIQVLKQLNDITYHNFILVKGQSGESAYTNGSPNSEYRYMTQDRLFTYVNDTSYSVGNNNYSRPSAYVTDRQDLNIPIRIIGFKGVRND